MQLSLEQAIKNYKTGFKPVNIKAAATLKNGGIKKLSDNQIDMALDLASAVVRKRGAVCKFVPASGAATRMFKALYSAMDELDKKSSASDLSASDFSAETVKTVTTLVDNLNRFPIDLTVSDLAEGSREGDHTCADDIFGRGARIIHKILDVNQLDLGSKPKGLIPFHKYPTETRTAFEEHLVEGAMYDRGADGGVNMVFTVSPSHLQEFAASYEKARKQYEERFDCKYNVEFSTQSPDTDIVAANLDNTPFLKEDGKPLYRPGGHGALLDNLNGIDADFVFLKNIDNVVNEVVIEDIVKWKRVLLGRAALLSKSRDEIVMKLSEAVNGGGDALAHIADECSQFLESQFSVTLPDGLEKAAKIRMILEKLNRPLRVCGMVKNEGEPGGGPYMCIDKDGSTSLQILESAEIDKSNPVAMRALQHSTHFNPVDIVCSVKDFARKKYDLTKFTDPTRGFISEKSYKKTTLKAQEWPGLWNGSMSDWLTQFVEVPSWTFRPVKTFFDLVKTK